MYSLNKYIPNFFATLEDLAREFEYPTNDYCLNHKQYNPEINIYKGKEGLILMAKLSGLDVKDLDISIENQVLTITGEYKKAYKEEAKFYKEEIKSGKFTRTVKLPFRVEIDKVKAEFDTGILKLNIPQAEEDKPKKINIELVK